MKDNKTVNGHSGNTKFGYYYLLYIHFKVASGALHAIGSTLDTW